MKTWPQLKQSTRFIAICLFLIWSPLLLFGIFIFVGHGFEPIISALHLREINTQEKPLAVGEIWEERPFTFFLEAVTEISVNEWQTIIPKISYAAMDEVPGKAFDILFSYAPIGNKDKWNDTFEIYACAYDQNGEKMMPCPLPNNSELMLSAQEHHYIILTPQGTDYVDIVIRIPCGKHKYYQNSYRFYN